MERIPGSHFPEAVSWQEYNSKYSERLTPKQIIPYRSIPHELCAMAIHAMYYEDTSPSRAGSRFGKIEAVVLGIGEPDYRNMRPILIETVEIKDGEKKLKIVEYAISTIGMILPPYEEFRRHPESRLANRFLVISEGDIYKTFIDRIVNEVIEKNRPNTPDL